MLITVLGVADKGIKITLCMQCIFEPSWGDNDGAGPTLPCVATLC